jgi:hypothetical protein
MTVVVAMAVTGGDTGGHGAYRFSRSRNSTGCSTSQHSTAMAAEALPECAGVGALRSIGRIIIVHRWVTEAVRGRAERLDAMRPGSGAKCGRCPGISPTARRGRASDIVNSPCQAAGAHRRPGCSMREPSICSRHCGAFRDSTRSNRSRLVTGGPLDAVPRVVGCFPKVDASPHWVGHWATTMAAASPAPSRRVGHHSHLPDIGTGAVVWLPAGVLLPATRPDRASGRTAINPTALSGCWRVLAGPLALW